MEYLLLVGVAVVSFGFGALYVYKFHGDCPAEKKLNELLHDARMSGVLPAMVAYRAGALNKIEISVKVAKAFAPAYNKLVSECAKYREELDPKYKVEYE